MNFGISKYKMKILSKASKLIIITIMVRILFHVIKSKYQWFNIQNSLVTLKLKEKIFLKCSMVVFFTAMFYDSYSPLLTKSFPLK